MVTKVLGDMMQLFNFQDSTNLNKTEMIKTAKFDWTRRWPDLTCAIGGQLKGKNMRDKDFSVNASW